MKCVYRDAHWYTHTIVSDTHRYTHAVSDTHRYTRGADAELTRAALRVRLQRLLVLEEGVFPTI